MSKRWLGCVVLVILAGSSPAFASLTSTPPPGTVDVGDVALAPGAFGTQVGTAASDVTDTLDHFHLTGANCARFEITPAVALPHTITAATPMGFTVRFSPVVRGALTCTVSFHDSAHVSLGTDFTIQGRGVAPEIAAPATLVFPDRRVDNAALLTASQVVVVDNNGDLDLTITDLSITGSADFTLVSPTPPVTIASGGTRNVTVLFDPSAAGLQTATLAIASNDPLTPVMNVALSGTGTSAVIAVTDVAFGIVNLTQSATQTIAVTNSAASNPGPLRIASATITGGAGWFTFEANGNGCLGAAACTFGVGIVAPQNIGVRCTPPAGSTGVMIASVDFISDSDVGGDSSSGLSCTAGRADASVDPTSLSFGTTVPVGGAPVARTVTVTNGGTIDLTFTATKVGARQAEYAFSGCFAACVVPPGLNRQFTLTFTPTQAGGANLTVNVTSNDPDNAVIAIPVTATSVAPSILAPANVQFNNVEVVTTVSRTLTITNNGTADLDISTADITINDGSYALTSGVTGLQTVAPSATASWDLTCTPNTTGAHAGQFTITSNAINGTTRNIPLACNGTEGILVTIPTSLDFLGVAENTVAFRSYRLRNTGNLPVSNIAAILNPTTTGYSLDPGTPLPASLAASAEVTLNIRFAPLSGADGGPATVTFSGTWGTTQKPLRVPPVLALDGDGLVSGFDVMPGALAFGDLRFDTTATQTFCIENTNQANVDILTISITPAVGTVTGEFTAPTIRRKTCGGTGGTIETLPETLLPGAQLEVTVVANPANRTGPLEATLTVLSNLPVNPTRTVALTANSITAGLTLAPGSTLDFGARDIQAGPSTQDITIMNTGQAALDLGGFARDDNGANPHFTFTLPPNTTLQPNATLTIPVTYTPTTVTLPNEQIVLSNTIAGVLGGPANQTIVIRGRGIDREIELAAAPSFPDTFRNPGTDAPVRPVTVTNLGEATLRVTAAMVTTADPAVWTLVDPNPIDIPGGGSHDFLVRFAPTTIGAAPAGLLTLANDDSTEPMATVSFSGTGIDRNVAFGAPLVNLGFTGVGSPVTIDEALLVASMNTTTGFTIARIELAGDDRCATAGSTIASDVFSIVDAPQGIALDASERQPYSMTFTSETEGVFRATAYLYLDMDPVPQAEICVQGTAVFVDAHGGGGCATGRGLGGGAIVLIAASILSRRRRRAAMGSIAVVVSVALLPAARADNVVLSVFDPTPATTGTGFQLQSPEVGKHGDWVVSAIVSHAMNPLVLDAFEQGVFLNDQRVVERSTLLELGGAYAFLDRFEAGLRMPLYAQDGQPLGNSQAMFTEDPAAGTAAGDLTLHGKVRIWKGGSGTLAGALQLTLPTATEGEFTGTDKPSARLLVLGALVPDTLSRRITLSANAGGVLRAKQRLHNLEQGSGVAWGLGVSVRALDRVWIAAEIFGDILPSGRQSKSMGGTVALSPIEWLAGLRYHPDHRFSIGIAAGRGLTSAAGAPEVRGVLALAFAPGAPVIHPLHLPLPPKPDGDADDDGIRDSADRCPTEAEDNDLFDDTDGCPDPDNDRDGIADVDDKCPLDAEDLDRFLDTDGCPEKDNDNDQVADAQDKCPMEPEDKDGFEDLDGCPDPDNDRDGIVDAKDKCPAEPETINGNKDDDGCADAGDSIVVLSPDRLETLDAIQFTGGSRISKPSFNLLGQVASTMRAHPEIIRMRVTCHVQPTGDPKRDQDLSDKRAQAIRDWLIQWGITASRVEARGFGGAKPLAQPDQRGAAAVNDRIEMIILERK